MLGGQRVIDRSIAALRPHSTGVIVVGPEALGTPGSLGVAAVVAGGETRSDSVRAGLDALPDTASHVMIHDAARPLVTDAVVERVVASLRSGSSAVVPVVPVVDTLRNNDGGALNRDAIVAVQTPQGFTLTALADAHASGQTASDDASLIELNNGTVDHVDGLADNVKITYPSDLVVAESILTSREGTDSNDPPSSARTTAADESPNAGTMRIGQGFDVHPWSNDTDRTLVLGGVRFCLYRCHSRSHRNW